MQDGQRKTECNLYNELVQIDDRTYIGRNDEKSSECRNLGRDMITHVLKERGIYKNKMTPKISIPFLILFS